MYGKQIIKSIRAIVDERTKLLFSYIGKVKFILYFQYEITIDVFFQKIETPNSTVGPLSGAH